MSVWLAHRGLRPTVGLLLLPLLILLAIGFVYPIARMVILTVTDFEEVGVPWFDNYRWFFATDVNLAVLQRTLVMALVVTIVCVIIAYPYAYAMTRVRGTYRILLGAVVLVPFWTSLMVRNYAWIVLLQPTGVVNDLLARLGIGPIELLGRSSGVTLAMSQILLPFMVLPLFATLLSIDPVLMRAARSLGAPRLQVFLRVYLPLSLPGVAAGALLVFVLSLGFYVTPALLGSPQQSMLSQLIAIQVGRLSDFGRAGTMAVVLLVTTLVILAIAGFLARRSSAYAQATKVQQ